MPVTNTYRTRLEGIRFASKKFLHTREAHLVFPSMAAFSRLIEATIELYNSIDPEEKESLGARLAYRILRLILTMAGDVTLFCKRLIPR